MKRLIITFIATFSVIALLLVFFMVSMISRRDSSTFLSNSNSKLVNTQKINLNDIDDITIEYKSEDVILYTSDTDELILKEYMYHTPDKDELASIKKSGSNLLIEGQNKDRFHFHFVFFTSDSSCRTEIYLPETYAAKLSVSTSSGDIEANRTLKLTKFKASSSSGDIDMPEVYADDIEVSSSSGEIDFRKAEGTRYFNSSSGDIEILDGIGDSYITTSSGELIIKNAKGKIKAATSSGDIEISGTIGDKEITTNSGEIRIEQSSGYTKASTSSGDISIKAIDGGGKIVTNSGEINYNLVNLTNHLEVKASSGDVYLKTPDTLQFQFDAKTSSGDIDTFFNNKLSYNKDGKHAYGSIGEQPSHEINISTTSGEINVDR